MRTLSDASRDDILASQQKRLTDLLAQPLEEGTLYLVGTPVGNLQDLSPRVLQTLALADTVAAEDTRVTRRLLSACGIHNTLVSYHEHNKASAGPRLLERLQAGETLALCTDAGMPGISDPGQALCRLCHEAGVPVRVIPGPSAVTLAAAGSGMVETSFVFFGFLPHGGRERKKELARLLAQKDPTILYEAPYRLLTTLRELKEAGLGALGLCLCRELTKKHEELKVTTVAEALAFYEADPELVRGEYALVLEAPAERLAAADLPEAEAGAADAQAEARQVFAAFLGEGMGRKEASKLVAKRFGLRAREVYGWETDL